jgi:hypothetical protein
MDGMKKKGWTGMWKGVGLGFGGLVLKPIAGKLLTLNLAPISIWAKLTKDTGVWGIMGYTYEGINKEAQMVVRPSAEKHIITVRKALGWEEYNKATYKERTSIIRRWSDADVEILKKGKNKSK